MAKGTNVMQVIEKLKRTFAVMGLPGTIVSDNGPPFNSAEFEKFCHINGINIVKSPPYHPQSNGVAKHHIQTVKVALKKFLGEKSTLIAEQQIVNFLFSFRNTPCSTTGLSSNEIIFKLKPKTRLDLLKPTKGGDVSFRKHCDIVKPVLFSAGETVLVGKLGPYCNDKLKKGVIVKCISGVTYLVKIDDKLLYKHVKSLRKILSDDEIGRPVLVQGGANGGQMPVLDVNDKVTNQSHPHSPGINKPSEVNEGVSTDACSAASNPNKVAPVLVPTTNATDDLHIRRSTRVHKPPQRLDL